MKNIKDVRMFAMSLASLLTLTVTPVFAAATTATNSGVSTSSNGMRISPVRQDVTIAPGQNKVVQVVVENVTDNTENLEAIVNDFIANPNETGAPSLLLNGEAAAKHGLKQYVSPLSSVTIAPHGSANVNISISIPANAAGGGYFGAVRFQPAGTSSSKTVNLSASVGSLILVTVPGKIVDQMSIASLSVEQQGHARSIFRSGKDLQAVVRFQNSGNVQEQPYGKVLVKQGSKTLSSTEVNNSDPRGNVLPDSVRRFTVPLKGVGSFGKYTVVGNFGYGQNGQLLSGTTTFYVLPLGVIALAVIALLVLLFLIFGLPRIIRRHDQSVLRRAGRR